jgi:hypothetical protein
MKTPKWIKHLPPSAPLLCLLTYATAVQAQLAVSPPIPKVPPAAAISSRSQAMAPFSEISSAIIAGAPLIDYGLVRVRPHVLYSWVKSFGILAGPGQPVDTIIQTIAPGTLLEIGQHWTLDYEPSWKFYSNPAFRNSADQAASVVGGTSRGDLSLGFSQRYSSENYIELATGQQTYQKTYSTTINITYRVGDRTRLDTTLSRMARYANTFTETTPDLLQWMTADWLHYEFSTRLDTAIGVNYTFDDLSSGTDMSRIQPQARISWRASDKISFYFQGGIETVNYRTGGLRSDSTPIYSGFVAYRPFDTTTLSVEASTNLRPSYFSDQNVESTGWSANLEQRLLGRFFLSVNVNRQETNYVATASGIAAGRNDIYYTYNGRLSTPVLRRGTIALTYATGRNSSSNKEFEVSSHQIGCEVGYQF